MAIALSSLRVTSDLDASGYVRGAAQKVSADQQMIAADKARNASLAQADAAMARAVPGMAAVSRSLLDGYGAGAQFEAIVRRIGNAVDRGMGLERANTLLDAAYRKFGLTADAAVLARNGFVSVAESVAILNGRYEQLALAAQSAAAASERASTQTGINQSFGIGVDPAKSARESADAMLAAFGGIEGVARAKAQETGDAFAADLDARLIAGASKSARDAAKAFENSFVLDQQKAEQAGQNFQRSLTEALGGGGPSATSMGATYSALAERVQELDRIEQARAAHNANVAQQNVAAAYGIGQQAKSAQLSAAAFVAAAEAEEQMAAKAAALRAQINPLDAEMVKLGRDLAEYKALLNAGVISQQEFASAQAMAGKRLSDVDMNLRKAATGGRVLSGELGNLGYQVNDVITGLALGQPIMMVALQQGGQIYQIFSHSKASVSDFAAEMGSKVAALATPTTAAFGAIAVAVGVSIAALATYQGRMTEVQRQLTGMGRASGASALSIHAIAQQNSSLGGLSTNEARQMAAGLAATGKVGVESIGPIVALGHDFAKTFGVDAKEATDILAKAFADPARGADELNQRLGFLDASTKLLIESLVVQGNRTEAVRILTDKIKGSIADAADITGFWARVSSGASNAVSDFFDRVGRGADRIFNGGADITERINSLTIKLLELEKAKLTGNPLDAITQNVFPSDVPAKIAEITKEIERLNNVRNPPQSGETREKQRGLEIDAIARATLPAADATRKLQDETKALNEAFTNPAIGRWVSVVGGNLVRAIQRKDAAAKASVGADTVTSQIADAEAQIAALDRRSAADRARFAREAEARRQAFDPNAGTETERLQRQNQAALLAAGGQTALDNVERQRISTLGSMATVSDLVKSKQLELDNAGREGVIISLDQQRALRDLAREQALGVTAMKQQADAARIQSETLGMSVGKAAEYTAVQNRLAEAIRNKQPLSAADIAQIKAEAAALGEATQAAEKRRIADQVRFGAQTSLLSPEDVQIAQQLKGLYPNVATALGSVEAAGLQANAALSGVASTASGSLTTGLTDIADGTKSISAGAADMSKAVIRAIEEMIIKITVVTPLMRALQLAASGMGGLLGGGGMTYGLPGTAGSNLFGPVAPSANGNAFGSNVTPFARGGTFSNKVFGAPTLFRFASGGTMSLGVMGEAGDEAVMPLRRGPDGRLGVTMHGGQRAANNNVSSAPRVTVINNLGVQSQTSTSTDQNGDVSITLDKAMDGAVGRSMATGSGRRVLDSQYGVKQFMGS